MQEIGKKAKAAAAIGNSLDINTKNNVLEALKDNLLKHRNEIFQANQKDIKNGIATSLSSAMLDRLTVTEDYLNNMVQGISDIINLPDPIGEILETKTLENGLLLKKVTVPLGVVGIIYESRPNVTIDAFALNFKAGNASILKGGKEAIETNIIFEKIIRETLENFQIDSNFVQLIKDVTRSSTTKLMKLNQYVDVLIPRGSQGLIDTVLLESTIPVIETGAGNCHIYVDESADLKQALIIIENAKLQRPGVCNAVESLVIHQNIAKHFIPELVTYLKEVQFKGDKIAVAIDSRIETATEADFYTEYLDKTLSITVVKDINQAIKHISQHHTGHSDAILTDNQVHADLFVEKIDSAAVYVNASTRFTDGFVFGLGAEIGISTQKLHARGPMGLKALTTYKYIVKGKGQIR